jgi:hypothetical protein
LIAGGQGHARINRTLQFPDISWPIMLLQRELSGRIQRLKNTGVGTAQFCKEVFRELPMEFAVEAQKLLGVSLEGSVG